MNNAKRGMIPPYSIFWLFYISRVVVSLTYIQTICVGYICSDLLISIFISFLMTLIFSIPAYLCVKKGVSIIETNFVGVLYIAFFIIKASVNVSRFTGFATSRLNPNSSSAFFALMICIGICYCAYLGIEGLSRFSVYAGGAIVLTTVIIILLNYDNLRLINLFPVIKNSANSILINAVLMTSNSIEASMLLCLSKRINGNCKGAYFGSICIEYLTMFILILVMLCVLGSNAVLQAYPIFTLFQMATGNTLSRLDIMHTAFWILAAFIKCTVLIYCSTICTKRLSHKAKCIVFTVLSFLISVSMTELFSSQIVGTSKALSVIGYAIFCVIIPLVYLIYSNKKGDRAIENHY